MRHVGSYAIDGHEVVVVGDNDDDDTVFYEVFVDGARLEVPPLLEHPSVEELRALLRARG